MEKIIIEDIEAHLLRKKIRNINIRVCAPSGEIKVSAPLKANIEKILNFFRSKIQWVKKCQNKIRSTKYVPPIRFENNEEHYFLGEKYILEILEVAKKPGVEIANERLILKVKTRSSKKLRQEVLNKFYRAELKKLIPPLIKKWEKTMQVEVKEFGIKKMKTRWGTCNIRDRRIWINLELAKTPIQCLEYIIVHELNHLLERNHSKRFHDLMDKFLPSWRETKKQLWHFHLQ